MGIKPMTVVPCIVCGKHLATIDLPNHADDANEFCTHGQYGSTVFDPVNGDHLAINVCDECIVAGAKLGRVLFGKGGIKGLEPWTPQSLGAGQGT
jgi:hypothetical protein